MVDIDIKQAKKPAPGPRLESEFPNRTADGAGWIISCPQCGHNWLVGRAEIMHGIWTRCPGCEHAPASAGTEGVTP